MLQSCASATALRIEMPNATNNFSLLAAATDSKLELCVDCNPAGHRCVVTLSVSDLQCLKCNPNVLSTSLSMAGTVANGVSQRRQLNWVWQESLL
jgi:hypothetical protein